MLKVKGGLDAGLCRALAQYRTSSREVFLWLATMVEHVIGIDPDRELKRELKRRGQLTKAQRHRRTSDCVNRPVFHRRVGCLCEYFCGCLVLV